VEPLGLPAEGPVLVRSLGALKVSVLVYNRDGADRLWNLLFGLKSQSRAPDEILMVDNRSTDASVAFVRANHPGVRILELQERFPEAQALNLGFLGATGDLVVWVDSALALPPDWLKRLLEGYGARRTTAGAVVSPVHGRKGWEPVEVLNVLGRSLGTEAPVPGGELFQTSRGAVLLDRRLFPEGPFEGDLPAGLEPFALGWRIHAMGRQVFWAFEAKVLRPGEGPSAPGAFVADFGAERRRWAALWCFAEGRTLAKLLPLLLVDAFLRPFARWFHPEGSFWGTWAGNLSGILLGPACGAARSRMRERRKAPDRFGTRRLSGRMSAGTGVLPSLWNAFALAYLAAVQLPTRENPLEEGGPRPPG
jgi:hypothetical protein